MIVKDTVLVDVLANIDNKNLRISRSRNIIITEMEDFGFRCSGWQRVQFKRDNTHPVSFVRISFILPNHELIVIPDTYVSRLSDWMAFVRLPQDENLEANYYKDIYLSAREYQYASFFSD